MESHKTVPKHTVLAPVLPRYLTRFIGHEQERQTLSSLLLQRRLLSLVGPGGIGKSRLALQIATDVAASFPDGFCLIELASLSSPQLVLQTLASALEICADQDAPLLSLLIAFLCEHHALLIFDNCEHVLTECAFLFEALLLACPHIHLLVTSREPLAIAGETVWRVALLSTPDPEHLPCFPELEKYEAIQLFCERATESNPRFRLTPQNAHCVAHLCHQLDGLPLALELAAALLPVLSIEQLNAHFYKHLRLLKQGKRTAPSRQQTLEATFDWSYALLSPDEQILFQHLAVFAGSWNLESLEHICSPALSGVSDIFPLLVHLVNASLVIAEEYENLSGGVGVVRYRLLEMVRQYAQEKLELSGSWQQVCEQHATWYVQVAEQAVASLQGTLQECQLYRLKLEMENLRVVLSRELAAGHLPVVTRLAETLHHFWIAHGNLSEGRYWFQALLDADNHSHLLTPAHRARVLFGAARFARYQGAIDQACALHEEQVALLETLDDECALAEARSYLGIALGLQGHYTRAVQMSQTSLLFYRKTGHQRGIMHIQTNRALMMLAQGDFPQALALSKEASLFFRESGNTLYLLYNLFILARAAMFLGDCIQARMSCREAFYLCQRQDFPYGLASVLSLIGGLAGQEGQPVQAARLFGASQALQDRAQTPHSPAGRMLMEHMILPTRAALGKDLFLTHYTAGQTCALEQILREAEAILRDNVSSSSEGVLVTFTNSPYLAGLSPREREILSLVATGLTDMQIAQSLYLSRRTVSKHVQSIYTKLAINSRSAATRIALENGLV